MGLVTSAYECPRWQNSRQDIQIRSRFRKLRKELRGMRGSVPGRPVCKSLSRPENVMDRRVYVKAHDFEYRTSRCHAGESSPVYPIAPDRHQLSAFRNFIRTTPAGILLPNPNGMTRNVSCKAAGTELSGRPNHS